MSSPPSHRKRWIAVGIGAGAFLLLALAVVLGWKWAVIRYLESDRFLATLDHAAGQTLHAEVRFSPLHATDAAIVSQGVDAHGGAAAAFAKLEIGDMRATWRLSRLLDRVCEIDEVQAASVSMHLEGPRVAFTAEPPPPPPGPLMPNRLEILSLTSPDAALSWEGGALRGAGLAATTQAAAPNRWRISAKGGTLQHGTWAPLSLDSLSLSWDAPRLTVNSAGFRQGASGRVDLTGEVLANQSLDLDVQWQAIPVGSLLTPDWSMRVSGNLSGSAKVQSSLPGAPTVTGHWSLARGQLEALPVLEQLAKFTRAAQFRQLQLNRAEGDFRWTPDKLELTGLHAESTGLARLEGGFTVTNGRLLGDLQIGIAPPLLPSIPGLSTGLALFGVTRNGYVWTTLHLDGPLEHPGEDLTARLAKAAAGHAVEAAGQAVETVKEGAKDAAKGLLDRFFGR